MKKYAIGIDVGGTRIQVGLFDENTQLLSKKQYLTDKEMSAAELMDFLSGRVKALAAS